MESDVLASASLHSSAWEGALCCGDKAPNVTVSHLGGAPVKLGDLWAKGPLVLLFHPGDRSGYGARQTRDWLPLEAELLRLGASVAVAWLRDPGHAIEAVTQGSPVFANLRDEDLRAAFAFGIAVAMPATYLIGRDGRIVCADLAADTGQAEPADFVSVIERLSFMPESSLSLRRRQGIAAAGASVLRPLPYA